MKIRFVLISILVLVLFAACEKDTTGISEETEDQEVTLLKQFKAAEDPGVVKVMSRNVYLGTDVDIIIEAESLNDIPFLAQLAYQMLLTTDIYTRADAIAKEVESTMPHLIGLQEMAKFYTQKPSDFLLGNPVSANTELYDFFKIFMDALEARGLNYTLAASVQNANVELPMLVGMVGGQPLLDDVRIVDHDVILVRNDVQFSNVVTINYDSMMIVEPDLGLVIPRGYAALTAKIGNQSYRFANTHLESINLESLRMGQAKQLLDDMDNETLPVIIAGDFNASAPNNETYKYVVSRDYVDTWLHNPLTYNLNGYTYGHDSDLKNAVPDFYTRIDYIFVKTVANVQFGESFVLGDEVRDITAKGLWPSDHGGVVTKLTFPVE